MFHLYPFSPQSKPYSSSTINQNLTWSNQFTNVFLTAEVLTNVSINKYVLLLLPNHPSVIKIEAFRLITVQLLRIKAEKLVLFIVNSCVPMFAKICLYLHKRNPQCAKYTFSNDICWAGMSILYAGGFQRIKTKQPLRQISNERYVGNICLHI